MEEIKIAPTKFWVIAAYKQGPDGFVKFWRPKPGWGEWVDDIARAKHYSTLGTAKRENYNQSVKEYKRYVRSFPASVFLPFTGIGAGRCRPFRAA